MVYGRAYGGRYFVVPITTIVVALLIWELVDRLDREIANVERAQFELRLAEIRSAVVLIQAEMFAKDEMALLARYDGANPMDWMKNGLGHYLGEISLKEADDKAGNWVFDPKQKVIAYLPNVLKWQDEKNGVGSAWLRFRVAVLWSGDHEKLIQEERVAKGLYLEPLQQVQWQY